MVRGLGIVLLLLDATIGSFSTAQAVPPADTAFQRTWERTDQPVAAGQANRTWMWGPEAFTTGLSEPYAELLGGQRLVQYFDKSRMDILLSGDLDVGDPAGWHTLKTVVHGEQFWSFIDNVYLGAVTYGGGLTIGGRSVLAGGISKKP